MDIHIGSSISLQFDEDIEKIEGRLVGSEAPDFFIVRLPADIDSKAIPVGREISAAFFNEGLAFKFIASILHVFPKFQLIFLSYPETYDSTSLRKEARINCRIPATASIERKALKGLVTDISNHGCQFSVRIPTRFKLYRVSVLTDIHLSLSLFGPSDAAQLKGKVRNTNIDEFKIVLGIEFDKLEAQLSQRLNCFIEELDVLH